MRVVLGQFHEPTEELLAFARQLGLSGVQVNTPWLPGERRWELADLIALRRRCEREGLTLEAIENIPQSFYQKAMLGLPGRDEELENVRRTISNVGRAGVGVLGYHFCPLGVVRTGMDGRGRGGAEVTSFDLGTATDPALADRLLVARRNAPRSEAGRLGKDDFAAGGYPDLGVEISEEEMWDNYRYFLQAVLPAAEEAGVRLAIHPDDPPVPTLGGIARIIRSVDALARASELVPSRAWAVELCLGTVSEMGGESAVLEAIQQFGPRDQIAYVHLRDVRGTVPTFEESFLGEGNYDPLRVIRALRQSGFDGFILDDHTPRLVGDSDWGHRGRAHAVGYIQALIRATEEVAQAATDADAGLATA
jgi:mannonate dehydratase